MTLPTERQTPGSAVLTVGSGPAYDSGGDPASSIGLVVLMVIYAPALLPMYVVSWLTSPFKNKIIQITTAFAAILAVTHLAGVVFEAVAVLGVFAAELLTGQVLARMDKRERNKLAKAGATLAFPP